MPPEVIRSGPLNVLIALADPDLDVASILPALQPHYALVCTSPAQALKATPQFEPDIVVIDLRVPDPTGLARSLSLAASPRSVVFVAMQDVAGPLPSGFQYSLPVPAAANDLEHLLWQIGHGRTSRAPQAVEPGPGMIG